jgi:hypothetical protein
MSIEQAILGPFLARMREPVGELAGRATQSISIIDWTSGGNSDPTSSGLQSFLHRIAAKATGPAGL